MRRPCVIFLIVAASVVGGCGHGGNDAAPKLKDAELAKGVLLPADVPKVFERFDEGRQVRSDAHPGPRADRARFGRQDGWKARYKRSGSATTAGPLVIESRVDAFGNADGAKQDLDAYAEELDATEGAKSVEAPDLGDGARAAELRQGTATSGVTYYTIAWREGRFTASVNVSGFTGKVTLDDAAALARKQAARLSTAR